MQKPFVEAATNLIGLLENNLNALYRIKDKVKLERQIKGTTDAEANLIEHHGY